MKVLTNLEMNNNEIIQVIIHKVTTDPTIATKNAGMIIYNTSENKLKYCDGTKWISMNGSGRETPTIEIDTDLSDSSTNTKAAGAKAVVDYIKNNNIEFDALLTSIKAIDKGQVIRKDISSGKIIGVIIDTEVKELSTNLITSGAVFKAIKDASSTILQTKYSCPAISGEGSCEWKFTFAHDNPVSVEVYENSTGEKVYPNIKTSRNAVTIIFNGISNIAQDSYYAVVVHTT